MYINKQEKSKIENAFNAFWVSASMHTSMKAKANNAKELSDSAHIVEYFNERASCWFQCGEDAREVMLESGFNVV